MFLEEYQILAGVAPYVHVAVAKVLFVPSLGEVLSLLFCLKLNPCMSSFPFKQYVFATDGTQLLKWRVPKINFGPGTFIGVCQSQFLTSVM